MQRARHVAPLCKCYSMILFQKIICFFLLIFIGANALACSCDAGKIPVQIPNTNPFYNDPDRCGNPPSEATPKKCWRWEAWPQQCMWISIGETAGYADEYRQKCPGVIQIDYGGAQRCVLPPTQTTCLCIDLNVHVSGCQPGEIGIYQSGQPHRCIEVAPPPTRQKIYKNKKALNTTAACQARDPNNCECPPA